MPITLPNGSIYKLCLLDTNALSEIVKQPSNEGRGYIERFPPSEYVPCFTVYNLFEIRRVPETFRKFVAFFRIYPSLLARPFQQILDAEIAAKGRAAVNDILLRAFTPLGSDSSYDFGHFIDSLFTDPAVRQLELDWRTRDQVVLDTWQRNKSNFETTSSVPTARDAQRFVHDACVDTLCQIRPEYVKAVLETNDLSALQMLSSVQVMLYSQYYRIFDPTWKLENQEATDVYISSTAPYVDAVVTEKRQAEVYRKVQKHVNGMHVMIATLSDIRHEKRKP